MEKLGDNVQSWLTTVWIRITVSPLTIIYFCFSVLHFVAQMSLQSKALATNNLALDSLAGLVTNKTQLSSGLPIMQGSTLKICASVPNNMQTDNSACTVIWDIAPSGSSQSYTNVTSTRASSTGQATAKSSDFTSATELTSSAGPSTTKSSTITPTTKPASSAGPSTTRSSTITPTTEQTSSAAPSTTKSPTVTTSSTELSTTKSPNFTSASAAPSTTKSSTFTSATEQNSSAAPSTTNSLKFDAKSSIASISTTLAVSAATSTVITQHPGATSTTTTLHAQSTTSSANPSPTLPVNSSVSHESSTNSRENVNSTDLHAVFLAQELRARTTAADSLCQASLVWPISELHDMQREDIIFLAFQSWVLGVSVVALLNESIPHICASMITHLMATSWAAFRIYDTVTFRSQFNEVVVSGACQGVEIIPNYWDVRFRLELAALIVDVVAMLISGYLTWKIFELFGWQTFKRVGASLVINRIYRLVLVLSIVIQLSFFFMATTVALWIDRMVNTPIGELVSFRTLYMTSSIITLLLLVPWLSTGWFGVRRELRLSMFIFLVLSLLYLGGWGVMFFATTFAWTFITWTFFAVMASTSVFLVFASFVLGVICRYNFGKGLHRHLNNSLSKFEDTSSDDIEKPKLSTGETFWPTFPCAPEMNSPLAQFDGSKSDVIRASPQRSDSSGSSSSEYPSEGNSFDALSSLEAGVTRSTSENSTGKAQAKRWVIE